MLRQVTMFKKGISSTIMRHVPSLISKLKIHSSSRVILCSSFDKHLPSPNVPTPVKKLFAQDTDILLEEVSRATTIDRLLELTSMHLDVMNSKHIVACFNSLHSIIRVQDKELLYLTENETFQDLCARMMRVVRSLDPQEVLTVYKTLAGLKVRTNTFVMQSVLKMLGAHLNNMNLSQLNFLSFLLNKERHNMLVDGLKLALPLVLQVQIDQQLDSDNINEIVNCLRLASKSRLKNATIEKIISAVLNRVGSLDADQAVTIIIALMTLQTPVDGYKELLEASFNIATKYSEELHKKAILMVVRLCRYQSFYHYKFFNIASQRAVSEKWDFESCNDLVHHFYHLNLSFPPLLDYFCELLCAVKDIQVTKCWALNFAEYLTHTGYRPSQIEKTLEHLCSSKEKIVKMSEAQPHLMIKFVSCLAMLEYFPKDIFSKVVDEDYLFHAWSISKQHSRALEFERSIWNLVWSLDVFNQNMKFQIPSSLLRKLNFSLQQRHTNSEYPLTKFIENGLGGSQFVKSGILTLDGHIIDHLLAFRNGAYPVSLHDTISETSRNNPVTYIEDLKIPQDSKIISIIVADENQYCKHPDVLKGSAEIKIKSLIKKSYSPVVINYKNWTELPDREKIPYLMREIRTATNAENSSNTNFAQEYF